VVVPLFFSIQKVPVDLEFQQSFINFFINPIVSLVLRHFRKKTTPISSPVSDGTALSHVYLEEKEDIRIDL